MTNDSKLFPPRPKWEADGYRPDEYSRWLKGNWRPIEELWSELGVDPTKPRPAEIELEEWLFDTNSSPAERVARACHVHGHLLKPGDVHRTASRIRCAQPPYDGLPIPRADIPQGVILSRNADAWIREDQIEDTALPLYEGRMIGQFDFSKKGWVSGSGRSAVWPEVPFYRKWIAPQYLMDINTYESRCSEHMSPKIGYMDVSSATNARTMVASALEDWPCGNRVNIFRPSGGIIKAMALCGVLNSIPYDWSLRQRVVGIIINYFIAAESPLPKCNNHNLMQTKIAECAYRLICCGPALAACQLAFLNHRGVKILQEGKQQSALTDNERLRLITSIDAIVSVWFGLRSNDLIYMNHNCDHTSHSFTSSFYRTLNPKGFWRVDKDKDPELRHTLLTLIAFHDLEEKIRDCGGDREKGIEAFLNQNNGEGWLLPETLCLADYGLGHDERAKHPQPVAVRLGPRFYDWQLTQSPEESWRECHLHARNLLGEAGYKQLLADIAFPQVEQNTPQVSEPHAPYNHKKGEQGKLFE